MFGFWKVILLIVILISMILCFGYVNNLAGCACMFIFLVLCCKKGDIKEINVFKGTISFYNIEAAKLFIKSPEWVKRNWDIKNISQDQIDEYKNLKLQRSLELTSPFNESRKKVVSTLNDYIKYKNKGYYAYTTLDIVEASNYNILVLLLDLFKKAKEIKPSRLTLKNIVPKLPANEIQFLDPMDEIKTHRDETVETFLKNARFSTQIKPKKYEITIYFDDAKESEFISFNELLRADFYNKGYEEILVVKYYHSAGTFQICEPLILRNVAGKCFVVPIKDKKTIKLKIIEFITRLKMKIPLYKIQVKGYFMKILGKR